MKAQDQKAQIKIFRNVFSFYGIELPELATTRTIHRAIKKIKDTEYNAAIKSVIEITDSEYIDRIASLTKLLKK